MNCGQPTCRHVAIAASERELLDAVRDMKFPGEQPSKEVEPLSPEPDDDDEEETPMQKAKREQRRLLKRHFDHINRPKPNDYKPLLAAFEALTTKDK